MNHTLKVIRNSIVLAMGYFVSTLNEYETYCWDEFKPLVVFVGMYIIMELGYYKILATAAPKRRMKIQTLIFT